MVTGWNREVSRAWSLGWTGTRARVGYGEGGLQLVFCCSARDGPEGLVLGKQRVWRRFQDCLILMTLTFWVRTFLISKCLDNWHSTSLDATPRCQYYPFVITNQNVSRYQLMYLGLHFVPAKKQKNKKKQQQQKTPLEKHNKILHYLLLLIHNIILNNDQPLVL